MALFFGVFRVFRGYVRSIDRGLAHAGLTTDISGNVRPKGNGINIGPFEFDVAAAVPAQTAENLTAGTAHIINRGNYLAVYFQKSGPGIDGAARYRSFL